MRNKAIEFLKSTYGCPSDQTCNVFYKPVSYGFYANILSLDEAADNFVKDLDEMREFLSAFDIDGDENAFKATCHIWNQHLAFTKGDTQ